MAPSWIARPPAVASAADVERWLDDHGGTEREAVLAICTLRSLLRTRLGRPFAALAMTACAVAAPLR